jgi:hypothetical protein
MIIRVCVCEFVRAGHLLQRVDSLAGVDPLLHIVYCLHHTNLWRPISTVISTGYGHAPAGMAHIDGLLTLLLLALLPRLLLSFKPPVLDWQQLLVVTNAPP